MTHSERRARRVEIAEAVRDVGSVTEVMAQFGVTRMTVWTACRENGVPYPIRMKSATLLVLAELQNTARPVKAIARQFGLSWNRVLFVLAEARRAGMRFPLREKSGAESVKM